MKASFRQSMAWLHTWGGLSFGAVLFVIFLAGTLSVFASEITTWMQGPPSSFWLSLFGAEPGSPRSSEGGHHFIRLHYALHADVIGIWIVGLVSIAMLAALISGVVTHARIFRDFFTFRPGKGQRAWLDAHTAFSVTMLPFMLMIAYSGLVIFYATYMPFSVAARYGDEERSFRRELQGRPAASAQVRPTEPAEEKHPPLYRLPTRFRDSAPLAAQGTMLTLHFADFGGFTMRWFYFLCGLAGTAGIGAGLILFAVKRCKSDEQIAHPFYRFVERANVGVIAGMIVACASYFWINRLASVTLANRAEDEVIGFHLVWAACLAHALMRPPNRGWFEQWSLAAALCATLPLLNMITSQSSLLSTLPAQEWGLASIDLFALAAGLVFAALARAAHRKLNARSEPVQNTDVEVRVA